MLGNRESGRATRRSSRLTLTAEGDRTRLVLEERGLPLDHLPDYGAGWQVHVEDLAAHLAGEEACDMAARWQELVPSYRDVVVG